jgi:hypothetical protein
LLSEYCQDDLPTAKNLRKKKFNYEAYQLIVQTTGEMVYLMKLAIGIGKA